MSVISFSDYLRSIWKFTCGRLSRKVGKGHDIGIRDGEKSSKVGLHALPSPNVAHAACVRTYAYQCEVQGMLYRGP